ncbi:MAG: type II toxin-antitoxin system RelE family toxin [Cumulibacter sp.]
MEPYRVEIASAAQRGLARISPRFAPAVIEFITVVLPQNPHRIGKSLRAPYEGLHSARRGDYRVLYRIGDDRSILIVRIEHRSTVYRPR